VGNLAQGKHPGRKGGGKKHTELCHGGGVNHIGNGKVTEENGTEDKVDKRQSSQQSVMLCFTNLDKSRKRVIKQRMQLGGKEKSRDKPTNKGGE